MKSQKMSGVESGVMVVNSRDLRLTREALFHAFGRLRSERPDLRARDCATELGVSEAELVAARCAGDEAVALDSDPVALLTGIAEFGTVMALTRSDGAVLESVGTYGAPDIGEHTGIVIGNNIDLRVFPSGWKSAFAVCDRHRSQVLRSLQIFDARGRASHKVYLRSESHVDAYDRLVAALATAPSPVPHGASVFPATAATEDASVDVAAYRAAFAAMQDTHDFFMLLRRFDLAREQGLRLADAAFTRQLSGDAHRKLFARAAEENIPLMLFVASDGMVQISSGSIPAPTMSGPWLNLIDPRFNLHLDERTVARAWAVRKPTVNGVVTSLELYGSDGTLLLQVFGERHEGNSERVDWCEAVGALSNVG